MPPLETENRRSPVAAREKVFAQLDEAKGVLRQVFPEYPFLPDYPDLLRDLLERLPHPLFMLDCGEIESMSPTRFWSEFDFLLDGWGDPSREMVEPVSKSLLDKILGRTRPPRRRTWRDVLWVHGGLVDGGEIPDPRDEEASEEENWAHLMPYVETEAEALMAPPRSAGAPE